MVTSCIPSLAGQWLHGRLWGRFGFSFSFRIGRKKKKTLWFSVGFGSCRKDGGFGFRSFGPVIFKQPRAEHHLCEEEVEVTKYFCPLQTTAPLGTAAPGLPPCT